MSTGSVQRVIIALVYSVNVCQMDAAAAAAACAGKGPPQEKKEKKKEEALCFPLQFYFHDQQLIACCSDIIVFCHRVRLSRLAATVTTRGN